MLTINNGRTTVTVTTPDIDNIEYFSHDE